MRSDIQPGGKFPDYELPPTAEESRSYAAAPSGGSTSS
jgi:hypothetical protein